MTPGPAIPAGLSFADLPAYLDRSLPSLVGGRVPAVQVALVEGGRIVYEKAFGLADRESGALADTDTLFQVASISKSVTAWAVLRMAQDGALDLDAPVFPMLRRWSPVKTARDDGKVTSRLLLSHTAGMSVGGFPGVEPSRRLPILEESLSGDNEGRGRPRSSRAVKVVAEPGKSFSYSGGGYTVLQLLIEERSGEDFAAHMKRTVLGPCGMDSSSFAFDPSMKGRLARAYSSTGTPLPNYLYAERAAAGLYTTAGELARLLDELYLCLHGAGGAVLDAEHAALFARRIAPVAPGVSMGLGYFVSASKSGQTILSHSGSNRGWRSFYAMELESGHGIVLLTNSDAGYGLIRGVSDAMAGILD